MAAMFTATNGPLQRGLASDDGELRTLSPQSLLRSVVERRLSGVGGAKLALQLGESAPCLCLQRARLGKLGPQPVHRLEELALGPARSRHRGSRGLEVFLQRLHRRFPA